MLQHRVDQAKQRAQRLDRLYQQLSADVDFVTDHDLQDRILDWLERVEDAPSSTLLNHVENTLTRFDTEYRMYQRHGDGRDDFPDDCQDCDHYGVACPLLTDRQWITERDRLQDDLVGAPEEEVKQRLLELSGRTGCVVVRELIKEWDEDYSGLVSEGQDLRRRVIHLFRPQDDTEAASERLATAERADDTQGQAQATAETEADLEAQTEADTEDTPATAPAGGEPVGGADDGDGEGGGGTTSPGGGA